MSKFQELYDSVLNEEKKIFRNKTPESRHSKGPNGSFSLGGGIYGTVGKPMFKHIGDKFIPLEKHETAHDEFHVSTAEGDALKKMGYEWKNDESLHGRDSWGHKKHDVSIHLASPFDYFRAPLGTRFLVRDERSGKKSFSPDIKSALEIADKSIQKHGKQKDHEEAQEKYKNFLTAAIEKKTGAEEVSRLSPNSLEKIYKAVFGGNPEKDYLDFKADVKMEDL